MKRITLLLLSVAFTVVQHSLFAQDRGPEPANPEKEKLLQLADSLNAKHLRQRAELEKVALENGWSIRTESEFGETEYQYIDKLGMPQAYTTYNLNAASTTGTNQLWPGGTTGLNLNGNNYLIGIWDGGGVRTTHQEFGTRVTIMDGAALSNHGTHVGGTILASGVQNAARGMANQATLRSYEWTDDYSEMASEAAAGLTLSNHSYGWIRGWRPFGGNMYWYGTTSISTTEDYLFGFYDESSRDLDIIAQNAPKYLIVWAASNDRNDTWSGGHFVRDAGDNWVWSTATRDPDGGTNGFDCIPQQGVAKNILTVGAVHDITGGYSGPSSVVMTDFSSWGPADDGRIKPDIVANGMDLYSTGASSNSHYYTSPGTSMAAPNVTGTLALLQEHYKNLRNNISSATMSAASLKGLVINTAHEAGPNDGPDYMFGWGLLNAVGAAEKITQDDLEGGLIVEGVLNNGQTIDYTYYSNGSEINATLIWTDPAGTPTAPALNPTANMLVNDLDFRVIGSATYLPWQGNRTFPASPAYKADNNRDNVETVNVKNPAPGYYTLRITHKGTLVGSQQAYSMIITGLSTPTNETYCKARATNTSFEKLTRVQMGSINNYSDRAPGGYMNYSGRVSEISRGGSQTINVHFTGGGGSTWGRVYVDWNQDGVFDDTDETFILGSGITSPYSTSIIAPSTAIGGYTTMRVRIGFGGTPSACGQVTYGETEDYTIKVLGSPGLWTGTVSSDWFDPKNWSDGFVPTQTTNVNIPSGTPFSPVIGDGKTAYCNNLYVNTGATLTQNSVSYFRVYGVFDPALGQFIMNGASSFLYFEGTSNNNWWNDGVPDVYTNVRVNKSNGTATTTMRNNTTCSGTFHIWSGTLALSAGRKLTINSTSSTSFQVQNFGTLNLAAGQTIETAGGVHFQNGSSTNVTGGTFLCGGRFRIDNNTSTDIQLTNATVVLNGSGNLLLQDLDGNSIHHLTVDKPSGTATIDGANLNISGNLTIDNGTFSFGIRTCNVAGTTNVNAGGTLVMNNVANDLTTPTLNWNSGSVANVTAGTFNVTDWRFNPGTTALITTGNTAYIQNMFIPIEPTSHFGHLVIQPFAALMGESGGRTDNPVNVAGNLTVQSGASWTFPSGTGMFVTGNSDIQGGGSLTFQGGSEFHTQGSLNISGSLSVQTAGNVLVNGGFTFPASGTLNITGGNFISDNAFTGGWTNINGTLNMTSGLVELTNNAPLLSSSAITNVSGGILRAGAAFSATSAGVFNPTGGSVEISGTLLDGNIFCSGSNWFHDLRINATSGYTMHYQGNTIIKNSLIIDAGLFECGYGSSHTLNIGGNMTNNSVPGAFIPNTGLVTFDGDGAANHQHLNGIINFYNVTNAKTGGGELRFQGTTNIANDFLANGVNIVSGPSLGVGGLLNLSTGQLALTNAGPNMTVNNFTMGGTLSVAGGSFACTDITNNGIFGTVNLSNGTITLNQDPVQWTDLIGTYNISGGNMVVNGGNGSSFWAFGGLPTHVQMSGGILDFNNPGIFIQNSTPFTTAITGGIIRTAGSFQVSHTNFTPTGGTAELYGGTNRFVNTLNGSNFYNLRVNKSGGFLLGFEQTAETTEPSGNAENLREVLPANLREDPTPKIDFPSGRSGNTVTTGGVLSINNNLTLDAGSLLIGHLVTNAGNVTVNSGARLELWNAGSLAMGASRSLSVNNGGALELNGDIDNQPKISRISTGNYALNVESGATIGAEYALFEHMNTSGVNLKPGSIVDHTKAFHYTTFRNGQSGGRLMTLNNSQTFSVHYANFPNNTWGGNYNVFKTVNAGVVTFAGFSGLFSGEANEWDPFNRIHWGGEIAPNVTLQGVEVASGQDICFEATNTLTVGGGGSTFVVQNGGNANLVAGQKIVMLEGTRVFSGGYLHARITTTSDYCSLPAPLLAVLEEKQSSIEVIAEPETSESFFKVYPNPTTGKFTLELSEIASNVTVEIYGVMGEQILRQEVSGFIMYEFDLSTQARGIYIIRVLNGDEMGIHRVIRQ